MDDAGGVGILRCRRASCTFAKIEFVTIDLLFMIPFLLNLYGAYRFRQLQLFGAHVVAAFIQNNYPPRHCRVKLTFAILLHANSLLDMASPGLS